MPSAHEVYSAIVGRKWLIIAIALAVLFVLFILDMTTGVANISFFDVIKTLIYPDSVTAGMRSIVWDTRLPVALIAIGAGLALGAAGSQMQTILDNPLADPYTLGISSAAAFGAGMAIALGIGISELGAYMLPVNAFVFALLSCGVIYGVARKKSSDKTVIVLTGIAMMFLFQALVALMQYMGNAQQASSILFWMFGSLYRATLGDVMILFVVFAVMFAFFMLSSWKLTSLKLGDAKATSLGVDVPKLRRNILICVSLLTATAVSFTGTIGFIGLVGPHIARMLVGDDQRYFLPLSAIIGALLLSAASILCKIIAPGTIFPIGIITSLIGIPFFMMLVLKKKDVVF